MDNICQGVDEKRFHMVQWVLMNQLLNEGEVLSTDLAVELYGHLVRESRNRSLRSAAKRLGIVPARRVILGGRAVNVYSEADAGRLREQPRRPKKA